MPIYEYQCQNCGHQLEAFQRMTDEALKICPKCQETALNRLVSSSSFQLKGTGWYKTDYAAKPKNETKETPVAKESNTESKVKESKDKPIKSDDKAV